MVSERSPARQSCKKTRVAPREPKPPTGDLTARIPSRPVGLHPSGDARGRMGSVSAALPEPRPCARQPERPGCPPKAARWAGTPGGHRGGAQRIDGSGNGSIPPAAAFTGRWRARRLAPFGVHGPPPRCANGHGARTGASPSHPAPWRSAEIQPLAPPGGSRHQHGRATAFAPILTRCVRRRAG